MKFYEKLRQLRGEKKQVEVAEDVGITPQALNNYEQGVRVPRDEVKFKLAKYYNKTVDEIFFEEMVHTE